MAMAQVQVLHDVLQSGIRWRVNLHASPDQACLVRLRKAARAGGCYIRNLPSGIGWLGASCFPMSG
jgi:hypothetical protein